MTNDGKIVLWISVVGVVAMLAAGGGVYLSQRDEPRPIVSAAAQPAVNVPAQEEPAATKAVPVVVPVVAAPPTPKPAQTPAQKPAATPVVPATPAVKRANITVKYDKFTGRTVVTLEDYEVPSNLRIGHATIGATAYVENKKLHGDAMLVFSVLAPIDALPTFPLRETCYVIGKKMGREEIRVQRIGPFVDGPNGSVGYMQFVGSDFIRQLGEDDAVEFRCYGIEGEITPAARDGLRRFVKALEQELAAR